MIQIKRGKTKNWRKLKKVLAVGQPGYDKNKHKLKVGDGETLWKELPYASGLFAEEILHKITVNQNLDCDWDVIYDKFGTPIEVREICQ